MEQNLVKMHKNSRCVEETDVGQVTAKAASKARDTQTVVKIEMEEKPEFYK